jgi:hypothetical protein
VAAAAAVAAGSPQVAEQLQAKSRAAPLPGPQAGVVVVLLHQGRILRGRQPLRPRPLARCYR